MNTTWTFVSTTRFRGTTHREKKIFGPDGDYYTSPYIHRIFADALADAFAVYFDRLGQPNPFHLVELGAGEGRLGRGILDRFESDHPKVFDQVQYSPLEIQQGDLPEEILGVVFSNEFFDALPVHRVRVHGSEVREIYVQINEGITEAEDEISDPRILDYMRSGFQEWRDGYQYEVNLRMVDLLEKLNQRIRSAFVITIDYGYDWAEYDAVERVAGTLMCYRRHQTVTNPYIRIGQQDMTSHVNFEMMQKTGERLGWEQTLKTQREFLLEWGLEERLLEEERLGLFNPERVGGTPATEILDSSGRYLGHDESPGAGGATVSEAHPFQDLDPPRNGSWKNRR